MTMMLNNDCLLVIFEMLPFKDRVVAMRVSRQFLSVGLYVVKRLQNDELCVQIHRSTGAQQPEKALITLFEEAGVVKITPRLFLMGKFATKVNPFCIASWFLRYTRMTRITITKVDRRRQSHMQTIRAKWFPDWILQNKPLNVIDSFQ